MHSAARTGSPQLELCSRRCVSTSPGLEGKSPVRRFGAILLVSVASNQRYRAICLHKGSASAAAATAAIAAAHAGIQSPILVAQQAEPEKVFFACPFFCYC